jgi:hypothetical protein
MRFVAAACLLAIGGLAAPGARAATRTVGPGKTYARPCAAIAAAQDGDVIEIDAGTYSGDVCAVARSNLTLRGVGGRAHLDAAGTAYGGKAIWVIQGANTTVENIEFSGTTVPDMNGAGIRQEGAGLVVRNCYFHDNEDGILTGGGGEILIEGSEFANNGAGDGFSHNMYIGHEKKFTLRWSYSHHAKIGHIVKSRADQNFILYNRLMDEADGTSSYTIDLPNGGTSFVIGNLVQQGPKTDNSVILAYAEEGATNTSADLYVVSNTFVNDRGSGTFLELAAAAAPAVVRDNIFFGGGTVSSQANGNATMMAGNFTGDPMLVDRAGFDYHLLPGSPCVNAGVDPGAAGAMSLVPQFQYVHPLGHEARATVGVIDIGAYELGGGSPIDGGAPADASGPEGGGAGAAGGGAGGAGGGPAGAGAAGSAGVAGAAGAAGGPSSGTAGGSAAGAAGAAGASAGGGAGGGRATGGAGSSGGASSSGGCSCGVDGSRPAEITAFLLLAVVLRRRVRRR